jgi:hypothetical protein
MCFEHRIKKEYICECSMVSMCSACLRSHRETCGKKYRGAAECKSEYFSMMLSKLQLITDCKAYLTKNCEQYK